MRHVNAARVLPRTVLREVQRWFSGGYLWVGRGPLLADRNRAIRERRARGEEVKSLAARFGLSARHVRRLLRADTECDTLLGQNGTASGVQSMREESAVARTRA